MFNPRQWIRNIEAWAKNKVDNGKEVGLYFDFATWNVIVRPITSVSAAIVLLMMLYVADWLLGANLLDFWLSAALVFTFSYLFGQDDQADPEEVPQGRVAVVTWFGMVPRIYRSTGSYSWTGKWLGLGRSNLEKKPFTDPEGYVYVSDLQIEIWNKYEADAGRRTGVITATSTNGSDIKATLLLVVKVLDPKSLLAKNDALMDIAERARSCIRTAIGMFTGQDAVLAKDLLAGMMSGEKVLGCFTTKVFDTLLNHSLVRNQAGHPMFARVKSSKTMLSDKAAFTAKLQTEGNAKQLEGARTNTNELNISELDIEESLVDVLHACGAYLVRATIGSISLPPAVAEAANQAAAQPYQLKTQIASAEAAKAARQKLRPTKAELADPNFADAQVLAAAMDPDSKIQYVHVSGSRGNDATSAAAILAAALREKK